MISSVIKFIFHNLTYNNIKQIPFNVLLYIHYYLIYFYEKINYYYYKFTYKSKKILYIKNGIEYSNNQDNYDFILILFHYFKYEKLFINAYRVNKSHNHNSNFVNDIIKIKPCKPLFCSIIITYDKKKYIINLKQPYNFNIVNNILLDKPFIKWYMKKRHNVVIHDKYELTIIDNNTKFITLKENEYIKIKDNDYEILNELYYCADDEDNEDNEDNVKIDNKHYIMS